jgi:hypothetical protein
MAYRGVFTLTRRLFKLACRSLIKRHVPRISTPGMVRAERWRAGTEKELRIADCIETKRCNLPGDRKPCITRSRFRKGKWLFSARLLSPLWDQ